MMMFKPFSFCAIMLGLTLGGATPAWAQIISQNPRPDMPKDTTTEIETITHTQRVGQPNTFVKVPRAGAFLFAGFDENHDYIIDTNEVAQGIKTAFLRADKDGSGALSLVELEGWRLAALGSTHASPSNYDFAPNFARTVSLKTFTKVLQKTAAKLDADDQEVKDGRIAISDLLEDFRPPRGRTDDAQCSKRVREATRRTQQQCRSSRGY